jgi:pilus assembly protein CpaD
MMTDRLRLLTFLIPAALALGLSACTAPKHPADYREAHPLTVSEETLTLAILGAGGDVLGPGERAAFQHLIREYHTRGKSPVSIQVRRQGVTGDLIRAREEQIRRLLINAGVRKNAITLMPVEADKGSLAVISFMANKINVPECGENWTSGSSYNWSNRNRSNFGCATQRNLGLTIANPGNLKEAETMSNYGGRKGAGAVGTYRGGEAAAPAAAETTVIAE